MEIASGLVRESLEELAGESDSKCRRHILVFIGARNSTMSQRIHSSPDEERSPAEIDHAARQAFIHGNKRLTCPRIAGIECRSVAADATLLAERFPHGLTEGNSTIFNCVMRVDIQVAGAIKFEVEHRVPGQGWSTLAVTFS